LRIGAFSIGEMNPQDHISSGGFLFETDKPLYTRQEKAVLNALANGKTRREIAKSMDISMITVRRHIQNLKEKAFMKSL